MSGWFASGRIIDLILALTAAEALLLVIVHRRSGRGPPAADVIPTLLSGACLMVALRGALTGWWWGWLALSLLGGLLAHLADLRRRWR